MLSGDLSRNVGASLLYLHRLVKDSCFVDQISETGDGIVFVIDV